MTQNDIRIGILGAARIAPFALIKHAKGLEGVRVAAVAEEYQGRDHLDAYAKKHDIPIALDSFDELLGRDDIDAVYLPLPIAMHAEWAIKSIEAGKHVLIEKPMAANAEDAQRIHDAASGTGLIVAEAMHFRYHPLVERVREIIASGEIGALRSIDASFSALLPFDDFRFHYETGGGGTIDMGCYPIGFIRAVTGEEPEVTRAEALVHSGDELIDRQMIAEMRLPESGAQVDVFVGMRCSRLLSVSMKIVGSAGSIDVLNFIKPEVYHRLVVRAGATKRVERVPGGSTYGAQLEAFAEAIRTGVPPVTTTADAVANMRVIDDVYRAAGLPPRGDRETIGRLSRGEPGRDLSGGVDLRGKRALVTGPTSGIGRGTAIALAKKGAEVILVARNPTKCAAVAQEIVDAGGPEPRTVIADLSELAQAKRAARDVLAMDVPVDIIVNNAGLVNQKRVITSEGLEQTMAVNYFAPFAMTLSLLPALRRAERARVINVTSNSYPLGRIDFDDLTFKRFYWPLGPYSASKLGNIYFTRELARRLGPGSSISTYAVHPGLIFTNLGIGNNPGRAQQFFSSIWKRFSIDESEGYRCPFYAATHPELEGKTGTYVADCRVAEPKEIATRDEVARRLWEVSEEVTGVRWESLS